VRAAARSLAPLAAGVLLALLLMQLEPAMKPFHVKVLMDIGINVLLAVSLTLVNGFTGQFSLGHAAFMAIGGYASVALTYYGSFLLWGSAAIHGGFLGPGEWLFVGACLLGGVIASGAGYVVALPSLRLRGDYLAIVTLGFGEIVRVLFQQTREVKYTAESVAAAGPGELLISLGGALGFTGIPKYANLFWVFAFVTVILAFALRLKYSTHGLAFLSIREDEIAAEAMGVPVARYKIRAFILAAFFAGIAGALFAHEVGTALNPRELAFQKSIEIVIMVVLGGMGSVSGAALAAVILTVLPEWLRQPAHVWPAGLVAVVVVLLVSRGRRRVHAVAILAGLTVVLELLSALAHGFGIDLAEYRMILYALSLIGMMILRPQGLFGLCELWEIEPLRGWLARWRRRAPAPVAAR
jgi:branched-chain amino acid transport system permease protein